MCAPSAAELQQQLAAASGNAFMLGGAQQDGHASMFALGDYQQQQQQQQQQLLLQLHSNMYMLSAAHDAAPTPPLRRVHMTRAHSCTTSD